MKYNIPLIICMMLLFVASAVAERPLINILVEPASGQDNVHLNGNRPTTVDHDTDVLLNVYLGPEGSTLLSATALFRISGEFTFVEVEPSSLRASGTIFPSLDMNQIIAPVWTMDGTAANGNAVTLSDSRRLLGRIKVRAPDSGDLDLTLDPVSEFSQSLTREYSIGEVTIMPLTVATTGTPPACTGVILSNANLCSGDDVGLTTNTPITLVATCGTAKCEYTCASGYQSNTDGTACVSIPTAPSCTTNTDCTVDGQSCIQNQCTSILITIKDILNNTNLSRIQKVSAIVRILRGSQLIN